MKLVVLTALLAASSLVQATECEKLAQFADETGGQIIPRATFKVTGEGRLYFHSAPSNECRAKEFVIPKDEVVAYQEFRTWTYVMYLHPKTGQDTSGWVQTSRLTYAGTASAIP
ncbi:hypothetical protein [Cognatiluteimonas weifangensis]|uniref:hypothetical protein n=1 Tax=Cognatiluteimonas weifangensis TaxID=2303539 RepID=UPI0011C0CC76|nr:hypothetical protein [Luteimonas weifangensis]